MRKMKDPYFAKIATRQINQIQFDHISLDEKYKSSNFEPNKCKINVHNQIQLTSSMNL